VAVLPEHIRALSERNAHRFSDWPNPEVPRFGAGVYTMASCVNWLLLIARRFGRSDFAPARFPWCAEQFPWATISPSVARRTCRSKVNIALAFGTWTSGAGWDSTSRDFVPNEACRRRSLPSNAACTGPMSAG
jgi:hypothetical protein